MAATSPRPKPCRRRPLDATPFLVPVPNRPMPILFLPTIGTSRSLRLASSQWASLRRPLFWVLRSLASLQDRFLSWCPTGWEVGGGRPPPAESTELPLQSTVNRYASYRGLQGPTAGQGNAPAGLGRGWSELETTWWAAGEAAEAALGVLACRRGRVWRRDTHTRQAIDHGRRVGRELPKRSSPPREMLLRSTANAPTLQSSLCDCARSPFSGQADRPCLDQLAQWSRDQCI